MVICFKSKARFIVGTICDVSPTAIMKIVCRYCGVKGKSRCERNSALVKLREVVEFTTRKKPGEHLQSNCLRPRHTGSTPEVMVWRIISISYDSRGTLVVILNTLTENVSVSLVVQLIVLSFMNSIQGGVLQQDNARPHTSVVMQRALQSIEMLSWPARAPDLSLIEHVWDIIGRQL
ncbi:uncharacterized protein TNCV_1624391 [Trichonephila clavipes]|nr:uncharacterized protein TNCV_1624391 [Trichonephila clavipes]